MTQIIKGSLFPNINFVDTLKLVLLRKLLEGDTNPQGMREFSLEELKLNPVYQFNFHRQEAQTRPQNILTMSI